MEIFRLFGSILIQGNSEEALDDVETQGQKAQNRLGEIGKAAGALALSLGAIGLAAVAALGVKSVQVADEFHKAMNGLAAETGAGSEAMAEFGEATKRIYNANVGENFEEIAKTMAKIKQTTGESGQALEDMTKHALVLRDTFDIDVEGSVNTANSLMRQFGITGEEAFTLIAQGAQNGANKNGDLIDVLNEYSPQFSALGFSAEQFTDILIKGAKDGAFQVDKIGDAIKEFTIRSKDGSSGSIAAFQALGLNAEQLGKAFAAGGESAQTAFGQVMTALANVEDPIQKNTIGVSLFGTQFEDLEAKAITALGNVQKVTDKSADTLQKINAIKYDSFGQAIEGIGRMFETGVFIPIGEKVLPKLQEFAEWAKSKMPEIQSVIVGMADKAIQFFGDLGNAIQFVSDKANIFLPILAGVAGVIAAQAIINTVILLYNAWKVATTTMTTAQWLLNAAMSANPIGLLALAIGALIAAGIALYMNWDKVTAFLSVSWEWMKTTAVNVFNSLVDFFIEWGPLILAVITGPVGLLIFAIIKYWDQIKSYTLDIWNSITSFFTTDIPAAFNNVVGFFSELPGRIYKFLSDLFLVKIPYAVGYAIGWMIKAFSEGIPKLIEFFEKLPGQIWEWLVKVYTDFQTWHEDMVKRAIEIGTNVIKAIIDFFIELPNKVWNWLVAVVTKMSEWQTNANSKAREAGKSIVDSIIEFIKELPSTISKWFTDTIAGIVNFGTNAYSAAGEFGKSIVDGIVDFIKEIPAKIEEFIGGAVTKVMGYATKVKDAISGIFKSGSEGIQAGMNKSGSNATVTIPAYASGTDFAKGGLSLVGENGPELVNIPRGSQVYTNVQTKGMLNSSPEYVMVNIHLDSKQIAQAIAIPMNQELHGIVNSAMREVGL